MKSVGRRPSSRDIMFLEEFRKSLARGKYTKWAKDLTEDEFKALLWAVGEYGYRASNLLKVLHQHSPADSFLTPARGVLALKVLADFANGKTITLDPLFERIQEVRDAARARMFGVGCILEAHHRIPETEEAIDLSTSEGMQKLMEWGELHKRAHIATFHLSEEQAERIRKRLWPNESLLGATS